MSLRVTFTLPEALFTPESVRSAQVGTDTEAASTVVTVTQTATTRTVTEERYTTRLEDEA